MPPVYYHSGNFPPREIDWLRLVPLLTPTALAVARLDGILQTIPNVKLLLSPLLKQEAVLSSRIEGTQATLQELFQYESGIDRKRFSPEKLEDLKEIQNYRNALEYATEKMEELPICNRLLCETHCVLLDSVRGEDKARGKFRTQQNFIGSYGDSIETARFIPIAPTEIRQAMGEWERFVNADFEDVFVQAAVAHAEFEAIHPFLDGNGRIGRMMIPLFLYQKKILKSPTFYISEYFEKNRQQYVDHLLAVSQNNSWTEWCMFFLEAVKCQAEIDLTRAVTLIELYQRSKESFAQIIKSNTLIFILDFLYHSPYFTISQAVEYVSRYCNTSSASIRRHINGLRKNGIVKVTQEQLGRNAEKFVFTELAEVTGQFDYYTRKKP
ncbi:MAG: Fic family protein [Planctomycetaceae bacterium]|jgi:Fic family protein|nr:Fic family protein [Planctomycetaceae bacterium]